MSKRVNLQCIGTDSVQGSIYIVRSYSMCKAEAALDIQTQRYVHRALSFITSDDVPIQYVHMVEENNLEHETLLEEVRHAEVIYPNISQLSSTHQLTYLSRDLCAISARRYPKIAFFMEMAPIWIPFLKRRLGNGRTGLKVLVLR